MCVCSLLSMIMVIFVLFGEEPNHWVSFQKNVLVCGVCVCGAQPDLFFMIISMIFDYAIFVKYFFFCLLRWLVQMFAIYRIAGGNGILALGIAIERWLCIFAKWWAAWIPLNWLLCAYACVIFPFLIHFRKALSFQRKSGTVTKKNELRTHRRFVQKRREQSARTLSLSESQPDGLLSAAFAAI